MTLKEFQKEHAEWTDINFGPNRPKHWSFLGLVEELGELAHSILKQEQGIRGTFKSHEKKQKDAVGDILVFLTDFCTVRGWDIHDILEETWAEVKMRDWIKHREGVNENPG